jgi:hypothetical protein
MRNTVEMRLNALEEMKGNVAWSNPRTPEQNELAGRYWDSLIHKGKVSKKLERAFLKMPRLRCSEGTNEVISRIADGILGRQEGKREKDVRAEIIHARDQTGSRAEPREIKREEHKPRLPASSDAPLSFRCLHRCNLGGLVWMPGQIFDNLARERGCPEPPDNAAWEPFNAEFTEVPARSPARRLSVVEL